MYNEYLEKTEYVDYDNPDVKSLAERLKIESKDELSLIKNSFYFVRDEIKHSWDSCRIQLPTTDSRGYARYRILHSRNEYGLCEQSR